MTDKSTRCASEGSGCGEKHKNLNWEWHWKSYMWGKFSFQVVSSLNVRRSSTFVPSLPTTKRNRHALTPNAPLRPQNLPNQRPAHRLTVARLPLPLPAPLLPHDVKLHPPLHHSPLHTLNRLLDWLHNHRHNLPHRIPLLLLRLHLHRLHHLLRRHSLQKNQEEKRNKRRSH